jgi:branched-subunit amino acid ABC-type transport system permease component
MPNRLAGILGLVAFSYALLSGLMEADNSFSAIVLNALGALLGTMIVGYVLGLVAQAMLNENLKSIEEEKSGNSLKDDAGPSR